MVMFCMVESWMKCYTSHTIVLNQQNLTFLPNDLFSNVNYVFSVTLHIWCLLFLLSVVHTMFIHSFIHPSVHTCIRTIFRSYDLSYLYEMLVYIIRVHAMRRSSNGSGMLINNIRKCDEWDVSRTTKGYAYSHIHIHMFIVYVSLIDTPGWQMKKPVVCVFLQRKRKIEWTVIPGHLTKSTCSECRNRIPEWIKNVKSRDKKSGTCECEKICVYVFVVFML